MATITKFDNFVQALAEKVHDLENDVLKVALTNVAPASTNLVLSDITEVDYSHCSNRTITVLSSSQTNGVYSLACEDLTLTASGGTVGPFRYIVFYNDSAVNDDLIGWADYGATITLNDNDSFLLDFDTNLLTIQ